MYTYTVISYRANGEFYLGGWCEGRSDSNLRIRTAVTRTDIIELLAHEIYLDKVAQNRDLNPDYAFTESAEISLGINGYFGTEFAPDGVSDDHYERDSIERDVIFKEANMIASTRYSKHLDNVRSEKLRIQSEKEEAAARKREAEERTQLAKLQEKYGVNNG